MRACGHVRGRCAAGCCRCRRPAARASRPRRPRLTRPRLPRSGRAQCLRGAAAACPSGLPWRPLWGPCGASVGHNGHPTRAAAAGEGRAASGSMSRVRRARGVPSVVATRPLFEDLSAFTRVRNVTDVTDVHHVRSGLGENVRSSMIIWVSDKVLTWSSMPHGRAQTSTILRFPYMAIFIVFGVKTCSQLTCGSNPATFAP